MAVNPYSLIIHAMDDQTEAKEDIATNRTETSGIKKYTFKFWSSNNLLGFFAFIISLGTFITFTYQTYLIRNQTAMIQKQQYAASLPYLTIYFSSGEKQYDMVIQNNGVGPAFIQHIQVSYEGKNYEGDIGSFIVNKIYPSTPVNTSRTSLIKGSVIPAGHTIIMIGANDAKSAKVLRDLFESQKVKLEIVYASVFDETWRINSDQTIPVKIDELLSD